MRKQQGEEEEEEGEQRRSIFLSTEGSLNKNRDFFFARVRKRYGACGGERKSEEMKEECMTSPGAI